MSPPTLQMNDSDRREALRQSEIARCHNVYQRDISAR
jgi:hypothetical protein